MHNGVAVIWHPEIDEKTVIAATKLNVISIATNGIREASELWEEMKQNDFTGIPRV